MVLGAALASSSDGVHDTFVAEVCVAIVVSARDPNFALSVCTNAFDAGVKVIVAALPSVTADTLGVVALGIVGSDTLIEPFAEPIADEKLQFAENDSATCFVPSALCAMVASPYAALSEDALSVRMVRYL
ncbi:hypothetical protein SDC9_102968 [bioreactor metagenome]|uniref:Uncharacterized protein n=1 Tax=bioreactor metagenome TaxID=1076179 RepID=A0A645ATD7_9ZZZZ